MPTLLVSPRMHPALAARVEASVSGRRSKSIATRSSGRIVSLVRLAVLLAVVGLVTMVLVVRQRDRAEFSRARAALLESWTTQAASLSAGDLGFLERIEKLLAESSAEYPGDFSAGETRPVGAFAAILTRPSVYVRGPIAGFGSSAGVAKTAFESGKDALLLCLRDPPASRTEKVLLSKARLAMAGGAPVQEATPNIRRLHEAELGLPLLLPRWGERVRAAKDLQELARLERELRKAPIAATESIVKAELLIAAFDEPNVGGGVTELDGEHTHAIRLLVIELTSARVLLRLRRQVDPSWITANRRSQYARELDGCKLALDVHDAVRVEENQPPTQPTAARPR
jgi:hypothetical protein